MLNLPNVLSILRMGLVPLFIIAVVDGEMVKALVIFAAAGITDSLDGFIARFYRQQTLLGSYLDPIADKMLLTSAYVVLTIPALNPELTIPVWVTVLVIARDVLIVVLAGVLHIVTGERSFPPLKIGKITTTAQIATVAVVLVGLAFGAGRVFPVVAPVSFYVTAALTVISGVSYIVRGNRVVEAQSREEARPGPAAGGGSPGEESASQEHPGEESDPSR
jgi:cardiolipin synthase